MRKVLNCDDSDAPRYVRTRILRNAGFEVIEANSGADAIRIASDQLPHVALVDIQLPDMTGFEVCRRIKADARTAGIRVLNISAIHVSDYEKADALNCGADGYLTDPVEPELLVASVRGQLRDWTEKDLIRRREEAVVGARPVAVILKSHVQAFSLGLATAVAAAAVRAAIAPIVNDHAPLLFFAFAVAIAAWSGGLTAGVVSTIAGGLIGTYFFIDPKFSFALANPGDALLLILFGGFGAFISVMAERLRQAYVDLHAAKERLQLAHAAGSSGAFEWFVAEDRVVWTPEMEKVYGIAPGAFEGTFEDWRRRIHPDDLGNLDLALQDTLSKTGTSAEAEFRVIMPDGSLKWVDARAVFTYNREGRPERILGINTDITRRKEVDQVLQQRTEALARSNQELQQFAYVASHDLQEPLRTVASFSQLLARKHIKDDPEAAQFVEVIGQGVSRMRALIQDLLEYSRVAHSDPNRTELVSVEAVVTEATWNLGVAMKESDATVTWGKLPTVMADERQLIQLFQNLLGNAIKYRSPDRSPCVHITASQSPQCCTFCVEDNGIGFDPDEAGRIFDAFQRLHTRSEYEGTGIGLAICKRIVERHGGKIWAESERGIGSKFYFTLASEARTSIARGA